MSNYIFRRIEEKYFLTKDQKKELFNEIDKYITKDEYYKSNILNIYFDNDDNELVIRSSSKPIYKDKVRLRSYNVPSLDSYVFLELKTKYNGITSKRRIKLKLKDFYDYLEKGKMTNSQIMNEIDYLFKYYNLKPNFFIGYDRLSYKGKDNDGLRITIDSNLKSRKNDLKLEKGNIGKNYFDEEIYIMEIKTLNSMPLWLTGILSKLKIYPISFSKYAETYKKEMYELC